MNTEKSTPSVTMMVGIPGSGKSTYAQKCASLDSNVRVFSSDQYRLKLYGDENDQTHNNEVFTAMYKDIREAYAEGFDIIIDATNLSFKDRERTRDSLKGVPIDRCVILATPVSECINRDKNRSRTVGKDVIKRLVCKFEIPTYDEFTEVIVHDGGNDYANVATIVEQMNEFEQHNPHHIYTVGIHCLKVASQFPQGSLLYKAGLWHDVGKMFTQTFDENGIGHYYQHANYSTYFMLCYSNLLGCENFTEVFEVLFYINQHMHIRDILKSNNAIKRYKMLWGEERFNNLVEFNKADNAGSGTEDKYEEIKKELAR